MPDFENSIISVSAPGVLPPEFFEVGRLARADDPTWIPEQQRSFVDQFAEDHWWLESGGLARVWIVPGLGRIAAFSHPQAKTDGKNAGYFGWWASTNNAEVDRLLLEQAEQFLAECGHTEIIGPVEQSSLYGYRLLDQRNDSFGPMIDEPDTPQFMAEFLLNEGFESLYSYNTRIIPEETLPLITAALAEVAQAARDAGFVALRLTPELLHTHLDAIVNNLVAAFGENLAYVGPDVETLRQHFEFVMGPRMSPELSTLILDAAGEVAGVFLAYPHYGPLCYQERGSEAVPVDEITYAEHFPKLQELLSPHKPWAISKTVVVDAKYRGDGLIPLIGEFASGPCLESYAGWLFALSRLDNRTQDFYQPDPDGCRLYSVYCREIPLSVVSAGGASSRGEEQL